MDFAELNANLHFEDKAGFKMKDLQIKDAETAASWEVSLLGHEVGCGKTTISTAAALLRGSDKIIVTVPPILQLSWFRWLDKLGQSAVIYRGTPTQRKQICLTEYKWIVVSHAIFRIDFERLHKELTSCLYPEVIVDEAHAVKSSQSKLFECVFRCKPASLQLLTGTPISKPTDAYAYIKLKEPKRFRSLTQFESWVVSERDFFGAPIAYQNLDELAKLMEFQTIFRSKHEIHGYDNKPIFPDTSYELSEDHMRLYQQAVDEQLLLLEDGDKVDLSTAQRMYHTLQQLVVNLDFFTDNPKNRSVAYDLIDLTIEETDCLNPKKSKLVIWTVYKLTSRSVLKYLQEKGIKAVGAFSGVDGSKSIDLFTFDEDTRVLVANPQSCGCGTNFQSVCSEAIWVEFVMTPLLMTQSMGRLDRVGQTRTPRMKLAVAKGTIQESLYAGLLHKDDLVGKVIRDKISLKKMLLGQPI